MKQLRFLSICGSLTTSMIPQKICKEIGILFSTKLLQWQTALNGSKLTALST